MTRRRRLKLSRADQASVNEAALAAPHLWHYLAFMNRPLRVLIFLIAFALFGAPFGMARMMGGHEAGVQHQHHMPQKTAPHPNFMVCAASVCVNAPSDTMPERLPLVETLALGEFSAPEGLSELPLLPPPRG